jgi:hypothetical protein
MTSLWTHFLFLVNKIDVLLTKESILLFNNPYQYNFTFVGFGVQNEVKGITSAIFYYSLLWTKPRRSLEESFKLR